MVITNATVTLLVLSELEREWTPTDLALKLAGGNPACGIGGLVEWRHVRRAEDRLKAVKRQLAVPAPAKKKRA